MEATSLPSGVKLEDYAADIGEKFSVSLVCECHQHAKPCGASNDPGPRDDSGVRWHWCYRVLIDDKEVVTGRPSEILRFLDGVLIGLDLAAPWVLAGGPQPPPIFREII